MSYDYAALAKRIPQGEWRFVESAYPGVRHVEIGARIPLALTLVVMATNLNGEDYTERCYAGEAIALVPQMLARIVALEAALDAAEAALDGLWGFAEMATDGSAGFYDERDVALEAAREALASVRAAKEAK